ncbi:MAG: dihydrolipoamide succinyltransferase, partial [Alphaproteobacteria bacterium]|nr:dihydrolipoamide succinyltransferase [Alphaproteobacteria bacterium]
MTTEIKVPTLGESITEGTLAAWLKKPGEAVAADEPVASLETDKVAVDVPAPVAGVMGQQVVEAGATVEVGALLGTIEAGGGAVSSSTPPAARAEAAAAQASVEPASADAQTLSPAVRKLVLEKG